MPLRIDQFHDEPTDAEQMPTISPTQRRKFPLTIVLIAGLSLLSLLVLIVTFMGGMYVGQAMFLQRNCTAGAKTAMLSDPGHYTVCKLP